MFAIIIVLFCAGKEKEKHKIINKQKSLQFMLWKYDIKENKDQMLLR